MFSLYPTMRFLRIPLVAAALLALIYLIFCPLASRNTWSNAVAGLFVGMGAAASLSFFASRSETKQ